MKSLLSFFITCSSLFVSITNTTDIAPPVVETPPIQVREEEKPDPIMVVSRRVSAYTSREEETDSTPCLAANGEDICVLYYEYDSLTCAANFVPFGTILDIPGYGTCVVRDRMAKSRWNMVDIYFGLELDKALEWGVRTVDVSIKEP
jgi:3D (Asp-Asp-Asp) domain-containing protein